VGVKEYFLFKNILEKYFLFLKIIFNIYILKLFKNIKIN